MSSGVALIFVLSGAMYVYGGEKDTDPVENPHFDASKCQVCHDSNSSQRQRLQSVESVNQLCLSCHDGKRARSELHPIDLKPSPEMAGKIPAQFPLHDGRLSCVTCHNVLAQCQADPGRAQLDQDFLRGDSRLSLFCYNCHVEEDDAPFNAHDQLDESGQPREEACLWCHHEVPEVGTSMKASTEFDLRNESHIICRNCHSIDDGHPVPGSHIHAKPSESTIRYMARYVGIPFEEYLDYQVFPLDENGLITCFSCHNPHERGLFPDSNPRSLGAEPEQAVNRRLRRKKPEDSACLVCHIY